MPVPPWKKSAITTTWSLGRYTTQGKRRRQSGSQTRDQPELELRSNILNLFDDRVEWVRGFVMPERNYRVGVSYTF